MKESNRLADDRAAIIAEALLDTNSTSNQQVDIVHVPNDLIMDESSSNEDEEDNELDEVIDDQSSVNSLEQLADWERIDDDQMEEELNASIRGENLILSNNITDNSRKRARDEVETNDPKGETDQMKIKAKRLESPIPSRANENIENSAIRQDVGASYDSDDMDDVFDGVEDAADHADDVIKAVLSSSQRSSKSPGSAAKLMNPDQIFNMKSRYLEYGLPHKVSQVSDPIRFLYYPQEQYDGSEHVHSWNSPGMKHDQMQFHDRKDLRLDRSLSRENSNVNTKYTSKNTADRVADKLNNFCVKDLSKYDDLMSFLSKLESCSCISFELIYRRIPRQVSGASYNTETLSRWLPIVAWCCPNTSSGSWGGVPVGSRTHPLDADDRTLGGDPHVIAAISFAFGDCYGFNMSLPCPLPTSISSRKKSSVRKHSKDQSEGFSLMKQLEKYPQIMEIVCRFVGFEKILDRSRHLKDFYLFVQQNKGMKPMRKCIGEFIAQYRPIVINPISSVASNPLMIVSRGWATACRRALLSEWIEESSYEWRLVYDIMSDRFIGKVAMHLKSKLVSFLERNIIVRGELQDPSVATVILETFGTKLSHEEKHLNLPTARTTTPNSVTVPLLDWRRGAHRAVAVMRLMAILERQLKRSEAKAAYDLFATLEMPLLRSIAELEYHGIPINTTMLFNLRQDLSVSS